MDADRKDRLIELNNAVTGGPEGEYLDEIIAIAEDYPAALPDALESLFVDIPGWDVSSKIAEALQADVVWIFTDADGPYPDAYRRLAP